ncbi:MAG TPA: sugar transferase [Patescibacteria group bacterium]|nr:sugar transferase [Patescibacteria group bacterium]
MKSNASLLYSCFLVVGDFLALVAAFIGAYILRVSLGLSLTANASIRPVHATTYLGIFSLLLPFWIFIFAMFGLYSTNIYEKRFAEAGRLFMGSFVGLLFVLGYAYASNEVIFPAKLVPVYGFVLAFFFLLLFRNLARLIRGLLFIYDVGLTSVLIIGDTKISHELVDSLINSRQSGYRVVGLVSSKDFAPTAYPHLRIFETFSNAISNLGAHQIHSIVQTKLYADSTSNNEILDYAQQNHIAYRFIPGNTELFVGNIEVDLFRQSLPVIAVHQTALIGWGRIIKRLFDLVVATLLVILASPFMLLIALLNLLFSRGVFFRQVRLTRFNQEFRVFKFRTQYKKYDGTTPEEAFTRMGKPELSKAYRDNGDFLPNDPRVTSFGRFLRRTSLDELPQLFNVLKGDLSLVGPRALIPQELNLYEKRHAILSVKSGLTGLAQVSGRKNISFDERRKLDMYYVQNWSFWFDLVILIKTIRVVLAGEGAK